MIKYLKEFKDRVFLGSVLFAITLWGIPFIPFVPVVAIFGGFKEDNRVNAGVANGMFSLFATFIVGVIAYATVILSILL